MILSSFIIFFCIFSNNIYLAGKVVGPAIATEKVIAEKAHQRFLLVTNFTEVNLSTNLLVLGRIKQIGFLEEGIRVARFIKPKWHFFVIPSPNRQTFR